MAPTSETLIHRGNGQLTTSIEKQHEELFFEDVNGSQVRDVPEWTSGPFLGVWRQPIKSEQLLNDLPQSS